MNITFSPVRMDDGLALERLGDTLVINGETFDFSQLEEGDILPAEAVACPWIASDVRRQAGRIALTILLPHGPDAPDRVRFPDPLDLQTDGPVPLPTDEEEETRA